MTDDLMAMTKHPQDKTESITLTCLPEKPEGWTRHMVIHLNFGEKGGAATYTVRDEKGRETGIGYSYDTRGKGKSGFHVSGGELMSWKKLRERWAELTAPQASEGVAKDD